MRTKKYGLKKLIAGISTILCITLFTMTTFADTNSNNNDNTPHVYGVDIENSGETGPSFQTRALAECGGGPHDMLSHGWGDIYNVDTGKTVVCNGACHQCTKCNLVIVTQGEPGTGNPLGYYTTWQPYEPLTSFVTVIRQSSNNIQYTSSSTIPGIKFRY